MTDEQIIMGLKCCYLGEADCKECPFDTFEDCNDVLMAKYVIDLIDRQQAEIERLNKEVDRLSQCVMYHDGQIADAIKEFAERLKAYFEDEFIDNLVKEMTEVSENG